jgi:hypothetical protein
MFFFKLKGDLLRFSTCSPCSDPRISLITVSLSSFSLVSFRKYDSSYCRILQLRRLDKKGQNGSGSSFAYFSKKSLLRLFSCIMRPVITRMKDTIMKSNLALLSISTLLYSYVSLKFSSALRITSSSEILCCI